MKYLKKFNENFNKTNEFYYYPRIDVSIGGGEGKEEFKEKLASEIKSTISKTITNLYITLDDKKYEFFYINPKSVFIKIETSDIEQELVKEAIEQIKEIINSKSEEIILNINDKDVTTNK